jgi:hypothetical protein
LSNIIQSEIENQLLESIQKSIESLYVDGRPLHHLPTARNFDFDPFDSHQSSVFVVDFPTFVKMSADALQDIFKDRHILVLNTPMKEQEFGQESLLTLGPLNKVIQIQGIFLHL